MSGAGEFKARLYDRLREMWGLPVPAAAPREVVTCSACGREIDFRVLADCHPYGRPGCAFELRGGNGSIGMPNRQVYSVRS